MCKCVVHKICHETIQIRGCTHEFRGTLANGGFLFLKKQWANGQQNLESSEINVDDDPQPMELQEFQRRLNNHFLPPSLIKPRKTQTILEAFLKAAKQMQKDQKSCSRQPRCQWGMPDFVKPCRTMPSMDRHMT